MLPAWDQVAGAFERIVAGGVIEGARTRRCSGELHRCVDLWGLVLCDDSLSPLFPNSHAHMEYSVGGVGFAASCQYWQEGESSHGRYPRTGLVADSPSGGQYWSAGRAWAGVLPSDMQGFEPLTTNANTESTLFGSTEKEVSLGVSFSCWQGL